MMEMMVAIVLFAIMATSVLSLLNTVIKTSTDGGSRLVATDLAMRELEITRDAFSSQLRGPTTVTTGRVPNPHQVAGGVSGGPIVVDGVPYTVVRTSQWRNIDSPVQSSCDDGSTLELAYLRVKVEVSWPALGDRTPVSVTSQLTPPKGTYDPTLRVGHIGLKVLDRDGKGAEGVTVRARHTDGTVRQTTTGADGCALFERATIGSWTVTVDTPGYVTPQAQATGSIQANVTEGVLWHGSMVYDEAASYSVVVCPPQGHTLPPSLYGTTDATKVPVTLANSGLLPGGSRPFSTAGTRTTKACPAADGTTFDAQAEVRTIASLWPYAAGYQVWMGACVENDPQSGGGVRDLPATSDPGVHTEVTTTLGAVTVTGAPTGVALVARQVTTQRDANGNVVIGYTDSACPQGATIPLGQANANGRLQTSLPWGRWQITRADATTSTPTEPFVTVAQGQTAELGL